MSPKLASTTSQHSHHRITESPNNHITHFSLPLHQTNHKPHTNKTTKTTMTTILPITYLGTPTLYHHLTHNNCILEQHANYQRQTLVNRCYIATPNGSQHLTIPIIHPKTKTPIKDILIDNSTAWQTLHWRAIKTAYNSSPFFEYFKDDILPHYQTTHTHLLTFNLNLQNTILSLLEYDKLNIKLSKEYINTDKKHILTANDLRETLQSKKNNLPLSRNIQHEYYQVFAHKIGFIDNLSIIDLLFNMGMETRIILSNS